MAKLHYKESPTENEKKAFAPVLAEDEELILATGLGRAYLRSKFIVGIMWPGGIFIVLALALFYFAGERYFPCFTPCMSTMPTATF